MIKSRKDLRKYIFLDNKDYKDLKIKDFILQNEKYYIYRYKVELRKVEYYKNVGKGLWEKIMFLYHFLLFKRLSWKIKCVMFPNTIGPGLQFYHLGSFIHIGKDCRIGCNFNFPGGFVCGRGKDGLCEVTIGDNCFVGINTTILGKVAIGNNVTIGAHSLVLTDIPDNAVAVGVPAKVIKYKA